MTRLVRRERTGDVHVTQGPTVRSQGRMLVSTACGSIIAGPQHDGSLTEVTCDRCAEVSREAVAGRGDTWAGQMTVAPRQCHHSYLETGPAPGYEQKSARQTDP